MHARRNHLILVAIIVATLVGVALLAIPGSPAHKQTRLGLDLQGGLEVVLQAVPPKGQKVTQQGLDNAVSIMRSRVDKLGVAEPEIRKQGSDQIVVQLPGVKDAAQAAQLIGKTAQLEFYDLQADLTGPSVTTSGFARIPVATASLYDLLSGQQAKAEQGTPTAYYLFGPNKRLLSGPSETRQGLFNARIRQVPKGGKVFAVPAGTVVITCTPTADNPCPTSDGSGGTVGTTYYYLFKHDPTNPNEEKRIPEMTGAELKSSGTQADFDPQTGQPVVRLAFTGKGNRIFQRITKNLYQRGRLWQQPQMFAIVLDRDIKSWPQIDYTDPSLSNGISGGGQITNIGSYGEAKDLAIVLQTGALPYVFKQQEQSQVSATLGKDSLNEAKLAAAIGLMVVALFLLLFYRFLGVIAVVGLAIYAALLYGVILLLHVTLTLPGFAGMILTIGVAADANVVIFERIKEEVRSGKSVRAAIGAGYSKGFHTIVDANVVTAITALVLFAVATAGVKGFALMLLIGTALSLLTAVAATRAMLGMLADTRWFNNPTFMGAKGQAIANWQRIDVNSPKRRRLFLTIATVAIVASVVLLVVKGLNLGIDFKGGTQLTFKTPQPVSLAEVRDQMSSIGRSDAIVQGVGASSGDNYKSFQVRTRSLTAAQQSKVQSLLENELDATSSGVKNVSSSFSRQIARGAIYAILVSFLLISIYISLRFQWRFAVPILRTLFNDILITLGVYSLSGREVTTATVAAVLTVLGYSIYDTIIVFDRVRENMPQMPRAKFATIANLSLWETMRRSLATTFITLLPIVSLLLFGGATLKDFAFALFIGIGLGAISTFFVATPFLTVLMERSDEFKRRKDTEDEVVDRSITGLTAAPERQAEAEEEEVLVAAAPESPPTADPAPALAGDGAVSKSQAKRERRRQRRRSRPHGRAR
ncbi:MAG TPA: protein translocase subunit SecD [Gaiellaceae bacterium]